MMHFSVVTVPSTSPAVSVLQILISVCWPCLVFLPALVSLSSSSVPASITKYTQIVCYCCLTDLDVEPEEVAENKTQWSMKEPSMGQVFYLNSRKHILNFWSRLECRHHAELGAQWGAVKFVCIISNIINDFFQSCDMKWNMFYLHLFFFFRLKWSYGAILWFRHFSKICA